MEHSAKKGKKYCEGTKKMKQALKAVPIELDKPSWNWEMVDPFVRNGGHSANDAVYGHVTQCRCFDGVYEDQVIKQNESGGKFLCNGTIQLFVIICYM